MVRNVLVKTPLPSAPNASANWYPTNGWLSMTAPLENASKLLCQSTYHDWWAFFLSTLHNLPSHWSHLNICFEIEIYELSVWNVEKWIWKKVLAWWSWSNFRQKEDVNIWGSLWRSTRKLSEFNWLGTNLAFYDIFLSWTLWGIKLIPATLFLNSQMAVYIFCQLFSYWFKTQKNK